MKNFLLVLFLLTFIIYPSFSQDKKVKAQTSKQQTVKSEQPEKGDKVINGRKGPEGQPVYQGVKGGMYYINKNGNKTYLKEEDKVVPNKKGPDGQKVYVGPQGGEYYMNKNGNKVYLKSDKK